LEIPTTFHLFYIAGSSWFPAGDWWGIEAGACSADAALRRAIPAFNGDVRDVQTKLEDVAFKLRIPQRKPWQAMADDVSAAQAVLIQPDKVSKSAPLWPQTLSESMCL
jgi:hypothetical protein